MDTGITYELLRDLKNAGFPLKTGYGLNFDYNVDGTKVHVPTLSELIASCGEAFGRLRKWNYQWFASAGKCTDEVKDFWEIDKMGDTPEAAVAKTYLEIKRK